MTGEYGQQLDAAGAASLPPPATELPALPPIVGPMCRCLKCCCKPGEGHNSPGWRAWEDAERGS